MGIVWISRLVVMISSVSDLDDHVDTSRINLVVINSFHIADFGRSTGKVIHRYIHSLGSDLFHQLFQFFFECRVLSNQLIDLIHSMYYRGMIAIEGVCDF